jgi:aconitate hydratase
MPLSHDPFGARASLPGSGLVYYRLRSLKDQLALPLDRLPFTVKVLLENVLRNAGREPFREEDVALLAGWKPGASGWEVPFLPARVLLQDFTGVPAVVDLAAMRSAMKRLGGDPSRINPLVPVDLVIDHSVQVDAFGSAFAFRFNVEREYERNRERYALLRWAQKAFRNFRVVPPGTGIVHQVNLEYLATVVATREQDGQRVAFPDSLVGTDSHTTMVNGLGVLGWGVGGIEAEAVMLGQPIYLPAPEVVGFRLYGTPPEGVTATDLVLTVTQVLRKVGVVDKFVEFFGPSLHHLSLPDRATIANMAPEYGATAALFPIDGETLRYLRLTGRDPEHVAVVERYAKEQGMFWEADAEPAFNQVVELDLATVEPSVAGPRRPQDRVPLQEVARSFYAAFGDRVGTGSENQKATGRLESEGGRPASGGSVAVATKPKAVDVRLDGVHAELRHGSVVIAAITSCTNTSNPSVMLAAGLLAKKAVERGLVVNPAVKTSLAPGSAVVTEYLKRAGLMPYLEALRFHLVGYGCTTCIGNSGPLPEPVARAVQEHDLVVAAVLSGNRNFEGRIHPLVRAAYLASPPLVVAFALAGTVDVDLTKDPVGYDPNGRPVYLRDIWPTTQEVQELVDRYVSPELFRERYRDVFTGDETWRTLPVPEGDLYAWDPRFHLRPGAALLPGPGPAAAAAAGHPGRPGAGGPGGLRDHGPHLARGQHPPGQPRGPVPHRAWRTPRGVQQLRRAPRQPRGDGAGDLRQHPAAECPGGRTGGWLDGPLPQRGAGVHLRGRGALPPGGGAPVGAGGEGVRRRQLPGLGCQGPHAPRGAGGDRGELRTDPPQQPGGHGSPPPAVRGRAGPAQPRTFRAGGVRRGRGADPDTPRAGAGAGPARGRERGDLRGPGPGGHPHGAGVLPPRRDPADGVAAPGGFLRDPKIAP